MDLEIFSNIIVVPCVFIIIIVIIIILSVFFRLLLPSFDGVMRVRACILHFNASHTLSQVHIRAHAIQLKELLHNFQVSDFDCGC